MGADMQTLTLSLQSRIEPRSLHAANQNRNPKVIPFQRKRYSMTEIDSELRKNELGLLERTIDEVERAFARPSKYGLKIARSELSSFVMHSECTDIRDRAQRVLDATA